MMLYDWHGFKMAVQQFVSPTLAVGSMTPWVTRPVAPPCAGVFSSAESMDESH